jgi:hypothetical protein
LDGLLDKKYVHKDYEDNVFLRYLRRGIPSWIDRETVETRIIPGLSIANRAVFTEYYQFHEPVNTAEEDFPFPEMRNRQGYLLSHIPHEIDAKIFENRDGTNGIGDKDRKILGNFYRKSAHSGTYRLKVSLSEIEEKQIYALLDRNGIHMPEKVRKRLSDLLDPMDYISRENVFYAEMRVPSGHNFFFEHPNEHVPGIMMMETARQFTTACWHIYGKVPLKGIQFILNRFNAEYMDYVDLHYPIGLRGELVQADHGKAGEWRSLEFRTTFFQNGNVCSHQIIQGRAVSKKLFSRLREGRNETNPMHRFYPADNIKSPVSIFDTMQKRYLKSKLWDISYGGFRLELENEITDTDIGRSFEFVIHFQETGFIRGHCEAIWVKPEGGRYFAGFRFHLLEKADFEILRESIKRYCLVRAERERV